MGIQLIDRGLYTVGDGARLLRISPRKVRGWIVGYPRTAAEPILHNDIGWLGGDLAFSFANLMEIRFLQFFAGLGVKVSAIRDMAQEAKRVLGHPHPFATRTVFRTDGRKIFATIADRSGDKKLYDLRAKNWAMLEIVEQSLHDGVTYDPAGEAAQWRPRPEMQQIAVHPRVAFGKPALIGEGIPTRTIYEAFTAENQSVDSVAKWYGISTGQVEEAVRFELELAMAA